MGPTNGRAGERPPLLHRPFIRDEVRVGREGEREGEGAVRISISNYVLLCLREKDWDARERGAHMRAERERGGEGDEGELNYPARLA